MSNRSDTFNRADTTSGLGTPSDGGSAWVPDDATPWGISSNRAYFVYSLTSANQLEASTAVATAQVTMQTFEADNGIVGRANGAGNYILGVWRSSGNTAQVYSVSGGTYTSLATASVTWASGDVVVLDIDASNNILLKQNGTTRITTSSSVGSTNTRWGLWANGAGAMRWDDFSVTDNASTGSELSSGGSSTVTGAAASIAAAPISSAGAGALSAAGASTAQAVFGAAGAASFDAVGSSTASSATAAMSSAGASTMVMGASPIARSALGIAGASTASFVSTAAATTTTPEGRRPRRNMTLERQRREEEELLAIVPVVMGLIDPENGFNDRG